VPCFEEHATPALQRILRAHLREIRLPCREIRLHIAGDGRDAGAPDAVERETLRVQSAEVIAVDHLEHRRDR
jgi:hypothetical protein